MNINTHSCDNCAQNCCLLPVQSLAIPWLYSLRVSCDILTLITHTHAPWHNSIYSTSSLSLLSYCTPFIFNHHCLTHAHPISPASPTSASIFPAPYLLIDSDAEISPLTPPPPPPLSQTEWPCQCWLEPAYPDAQLGLAQACGKEYCLF